MLERSLATFSPRDRVARRFSSAPATAPAMSGARADMLRMARSASRRWSMPGELPAGAPAEDLGQPAGRSRSPGVTPRLSAHARTMAVLRSVGVPVTGIP